MYYVYVSIPSPFVELNEPICMKYVVPPPEPSGHFEEALKLLHQFLQESDLDAAQQCVGIYETLLADFHADVLAHDSDFSAKPSEFDDARRPIGSQRRYHILIQLARILDERYVYAGDVPDLESALRYGAEALAACRAEELICPTVWAFYADILVRSFEATKNSTDLQMAEILCRDAILLCVPAHPLNSTTCHALSRVYVRKFDQTGDVSLLKEALHLERVGLERLPGAESRDRHRHLCTLAVVLGLNHIRGHHQDKDDTLSIMSEAFRLCPPMHVDRWMVHTRMMWQLLFDYHVSGNLELLNRAIDLGYQALNKGNFPNPSRRAGFLF
jgi:hypothetical protein